MYGRGPGNVNEKGDGLYERGSTGTPSQIMGETQKRVYRRESLRGRLVDKF